MQVKCKLDVFIPSLKHTKIVNSRLKKRLSVVYKQVNYREQTVTPIKYARLS